MMRNMGLTYQHTTWNENIYSHGEVKVIFSGRGKVDNSENVKLFSFPVDPHHLVVRGEKIRGLLCDFSSKNICDFYIFLKKRNVKKLKVKVIFRGKISSNWISFEKKIYRIKVEWSNRHLHAITFPSKYQIVNVFPKGYKLDRNRNGVTISWLWKKGFSGDIIVKFK